MAAVTFDTLKFAEKLEASGFTHTQAKAVAEAFADATSQELATKADIASLRSDMEKIELRLTNTLTLRLGGMIAASVAFLAAIKFFGH
ncbi:MAG: CCDC90 family protein [Alphaproteobacteria bacterium]